MSFESVFSVVFKDGNDDNASPPIQLIEPLSSSSLVINAHDNDGGNPDSIDPVTDDPDPPEDYVYGSSLSADPHDPHDDSADQIIPDTYMPTCVLYI